MLEFDLRQSAWRAWSDAIQEALVFGFLLALLCLGLWWILHRTLTTRVRKLVRATERIAKGDLNSQAALSAGDELGHISEAIDQMADELRRNTSTLRESENRLRS